jgi:predicted dehydrogenase
MAGGGLVIVGCGSIARRHAEAARRLGVPLVFASRDGARALAFAREFGGVGAHGSYAEGLADARAEGAIVCTPHDRHAADTAAALAAGKHVLVEKPVACTVEEADRMIAAAAAAGRVLMVSEHFRFMPAFRWVREVVDAGRLGDLREIHLIARGFRQHAGWRLDAAAAGGGALMDGGIHYVHLLRWWGGRVRHVFALRPPATVAGMSGEDAMTLLAELESGVVGLVSNSLGARGMPPLQWSTVTGTRGSCFVDNRGRFAVLRDGGGTTVRLFRRDTRGHEGTIHAFREAIARGRADEMDAAEGRGDLAVVLAAYRSVRERRPVEPAC